VTVLSEQAKTASLQEKIKVLGILVSSFGFGLYFGWDHSSIFLGLGILGLIIFVFGLVSGAFSAKKENMS
jgi:hypothetical protein